MRESEEKFRVLAETSSAMFWLYQGERFIYVNGAGERLTGYTIDELLKMRFWDVVHPDDRDLVRERELARQRGEPVPSKYEVKLLSKSGEIRWVELTAGRIIYRGEPAGVATFFDITERKRAEEALSSSQHMLQLVMDNIPQAVFWKDRNSVLIGCNKVLAAAAGLSGTPEDIRGKTDYDLPYVAREQADFFRECDRRIMENDRPEYHIIEQQREFDGRNAWVETNKVPLHDANGTVIGILGTYEDITERKRAEIALRSYS